MEASLKGTLDKITERINTQESERLYKCNACGIEKTHDNFKDDNYCRNCIALARIKTAIPSIYILRDTERDYKQYIDSSVFCHGHAGTGKTQFVASLAKDIIASGRNVVWYSFPTLVMRIQCAYRDELHDPFKLILDIAKDSSTVVFDDIGIEKMTDFVRQTIYMLINERYQRQLQTLITSNKTLQDIDTLIHAGIASRIAGMCTVLEFKGKDFRLAKKEV